MDCAFEIGVRPLFGMQSWQLNESASFGDLLPRRSLQAICTRAGAGFCGGCFEHCRAGRSQARRPHLLDALEPASDTFGAALAESLAVDTAWARAIAAPEEGAAATSAMHPRLGRAAYQGSRAIGTPDAGAIAVLVWMRAIAEVLR